TERSVSRFEVRDRIATIASLRPFFHPNAVAVVGASRDPASVGYRILTALLQNRFHGPVYPVNPKASSICGVRAYPSVRALPEAVDIAVVAVPRDAVLTVVDECADRKCTSLGGDHRGLCRSRCGGARTPEAVAEQGTRPRDANDRPKLPGAGERRPGGTAQCLVLT